MRDTIENTGAVVAGVCLGIIGVTVLKLLVEANVTVIYLEAVIAELHESNKRMQASIAENKGE